MELLKNWWETNVQQLAENHIFQTASICSLLKRDPQNVIGVAEIFS